MHNTACVVLAECKGMSTSVLTATNHYKHTPRLVLYRPLQTNRIIILDDQARQQITRRFQLSLQCNVLSITGFIRHTKCCIEVTIGSDESFVGVLDRLK